jgi:hypothetical protein
MTREFITMTGQGTTSTFVESPLQINFFMQNKPNFLNNQMNINPDMTKHYGNFHFLGRRKNKAKTNPIKPNFFTL